MNQCMTDTKHTVAEQYSLAKTYCKQTFGSEKKSEESKEFQCMVLEFKALKHDIAKVSKETCKHTHHASVILTWHRYLYCESFIYSFMYSSTYIYTCAHTHARLMMRQSYSKAKKLGKTQQTMVASWHDFALAFARMGTHNKVMQQKIDSISTTTDHGEKDQQLYGLAATTAADDDEEEEEDDDGARERKGREGTRRAKEKDSSERVMQAFVPFSNELNDHAQAHIDEFRTLIIRPLGALHTVDVSRCV